MKTVDYHIIADENSRAEMNKVALDYLSRGFAVTTRYMPAIGISLSVIDANLKAIADAERIIYVPDSDPKVGMSVSMMYEIEYATKCCSKTVYTWNSKEGCVK